MVPFFWEVESEALGKQVIAYISQDTSASG